MTTLNSRIPEGPIKDKWTLYKDKINLVNPANKRNIDIIVIGTHSRKWLENIVMGSDLSRDRQLASAAGEEEIKRAKKAKAA